MVCLHGLIRSSISLLAILICATTRDCTGLYFYAYDYASWVDTVFVYRNTSILRDEGVLQMNPYVNATLGRALYKTTFEMKNSTNGSLASFNTSFVFSMNTDRAKEFYGDGLAFLICPNPFRGEDVQASAGGYLGMFNSNTTGQLRNNVFAVEFDTHLNRQFKDPNGNHIGIDVNSVISLKTNNLSSLGIILNEGKKLVCWVDYDGNKKYVWVYLAHTPSDKPSKPAIAMALDLALYMRDNMYVGFSSATGTRAELHTVYSWWFLTGFGNLTLPIFASSPRRPLATFGRKSTVIAVFMLAVLLGFFCCMCVLARRQCKKRSEHLVDILLPVARWMYWKETMNLGVRSMSSLKLATPSVELLTWLWRTRWDRSQYEFEVMTWKERLLKRKMRGPYRGEAWQLENRRRKKRRKKNGAFHVGEDGSGDNQSRRGMKVIDKELGERYKIGNDSFIILEEESEVRVFQKRGSFCIAQGAPDDRQQSASSEPVMAQGVAGTDGCLVGDYAGDKLFTRRGSFSVHPDMSTSARALDEGREKVESMNHLARSFDGRRGSFSVQPEDAGSFMGVQESKPHGQYAVEDDVETSIGRDRVGKRGSFSMHVEDTGSKPRTQYVAEQDPRSGRVFDARRGSMHPEDVSHFAGVHALREGKPSVQHIVQDALRSSSGRVFDARRGSFSIHPDEGAVKLTDVHASKKGKKPRVQYDVEHDSKKNSGKVFDVRRGSFSLDSEDVIEFTSVHKAKEHKLPTHAPYVVERKQENSPHKVFEARRGSFSVHPEDAREFRGVHASREGQRYVWEHDDDNDIEASHRRGHDVRRGSFMILNEAGSSSKPVWPAQESQNMTIHDEHPTSDHSPLPQHHVSEGEDGGESHTTQSWLFE